MYKLNMSSWKSQLYLPRVRIANIYSTGYLYRGTIERPINEELLLGSLSSYYDLYQNQLPRLLPEEFLLNPGESPNIGIGHDISGIEELTADAMLFALPSQQVVLAVLFDFDCDVTDVSPIVALLEQCVEGKILLDGQWIKDALSERMVKLRGIQERDKRLGGGEFALYPERHQLVYIRRHHESEEPLAADLVRQILYRQTPPFNEEFARAWTPEQLNRVRQAPSHAADDADWRPLLKPKKSLEESGGFMFRQETLGVVTPYVTLLFGHEPYIEETVLLSGVHVVGVASQLHQIRSETNEQMQLYLRTTQERQPGVQTRDSLEELADRFGNLEIDLTFNVELTQLHIETFQAALYSAMGLESQTRALSDVFTRVTNSLQNMIVAITAREQRRNDRQHEWSSLSAGLLSLTGILVGFVLAIASTDETGNFLASAIPVKDAQIFLYSSVEILTLSVILISFLPYLRNRLSPESRSDRRALHAALITAGTGLTFVVGAHIIDAVASDFPQLNGILLRNLGWFITAVGVGIGGMWALRRHQHSR